MKWGRVCLLSLIGLGLPAVAKQPVPDGLSAADWSSIGALCEAGRHGVYPQTDGTHVARNPGQQWNAEFDGRGVLVRPDHGDWTWGLELRAVDATPPPDCPEITAEGGRLSYRWGENVEEWFLNDRRGLEQGWTIRSRSTGRAPNSKHLTLRLALRGGLRPQISADRRRVAFQTSDGTTAVTYGGLKAWDATNQPLEVRFATGRDAETLTILLDDSEATYPIMIDPIAQQEAYLKASNPGMNDFLGLAVAISGDTVVIGAPSEDSPATDVNGAQGDAPDPNPAEPGNNFDSGAAYVFVRSGKTWTQQAYLKASNAEQRDSFGRSVAISGDTVVIGADGEDSAATGVSGNQADNSSSGSGAAYVFVRSGTTWSQQAYLKASNAGPNDYFGTSVAISGDTVAVGASGEDSAATGANGNQADDSTSGSGAAYVFVRSGTTWSQQAYLKASNPGYRDEFGASVAVSGDTVVVGALREDSEATGVNGVQGDAPKPDPEQLENRFDSGAAYVFARSGKTWSQQAYLKASNTGKEDEFGISVAVAGDSAVVGAWNEQSAATGVNGDDSNNDLYQAGAAYLFVRNGAAWRQQAYLKASNTGGGDHFGRSVAISDDHVLVGAGWESSAATGVNANGNDDSAQWAGAAYLFARGGVTWSPLAYLKASNTRAGDAFGYAVAISGSSMIVGAPTEDLWVAPVIENSGAAYLFDLLDPEIAVEQAAGVGLTSGLAISDFGTLALGQSSSLDFVIRNAGGASLAGLVPNVSGANADDFSVSEPPAMTVPGGGMTTLTVTLAPQASGSRTAVLSIASNDADENPFTITLTGNALSYLVDSDADGMNDGAEHLLQDLGFDWRRPQVGLVTTYYANADKAGLFTAKEVQALHAPTPLIARNAETGKFTLTIDLEKSTDLVNFFDFPANVPGARVSVNPEGNLEFEFESPDDASFFRVEVK